MCIVASIVLFFVDTPQDLLQASVQYIHLFLLQVRETRLDLFMIPRQKKLLLNAPIYIYIYIEE